ncbi:hypothetical protein PV328_010243 [Microctonus aethiopoides]|uniref:protein-tyrosine-phosphatase n=1 Tax=Microctonus aethiopoides TaxID=144406 RepID=A0AA39F1C1_9HYME|nr:hypothetical protein PV328_010243 [Microctonus aethiopoides]
MSSRRGLQCIRHFFLMVIIISKLSWTLGSVTPIYHDDNEQIDPMENIIARNEYSDSITTTTTFSPSLFITTISDIYDSKDMKITTIKPNTNEFTTEKPIKSTHINTETSVIISPTPNNTPDAANLPDCEGYESTKPEDNPTHYFRLKTAILGDNDDGNATVEDLTFVNTTESAMTIAWSPPKNISTYVQWYILAWSSDTPIPLCRISNKTFVYTIKNLKACSKFSVAVRPFINNKLGEPRTIVAKTKLIVNENTLKLKIDKSGAHWLKLSWNMPNAECITGHDITYCDKINCKKVNSSTTYYNATDLMPCTEYNFTVAPHDESDNFGNLSIIGNTEFQKPGPPLSAWAVPGINFLNVSWSPPLDASCVIAYRVTISPDTPSGTVNTTGTDLQFLNLTSCKIYEVIIIPIDENGDDSNPEIIPSIQTLAPIPQSPSLQYQPTSTNDTIVLSWNLQINQMNNCSNIEIITECKAIEVLGVGYEGLNGTSSFNITDGNRQTIIRNLSPYTNYSCHSVASNSQGTSNKSHEIHILTRDYVPSSPIANIFGITHKNFTIKWKKPEYLPGELILFEVEFKWFYLFHRPEWCEKLSKPEPEIVGNINGDVFSLTYDKIKPFATYNMRIRAKTRAGWGVYSDYIEFRTLPGAPGPVSNLEFYIRESSEDKNILEAYLTWGWPCFVNAEDINFFNITAIGERPKFQPHQFTDEMHGGLKACINDTCTYKFQNNQLKEEYNYKFLIAGKADNAPKLGEVTEIMETFPAGIPPSPNINYTNQITIDPYKIRKTTTTATVLLPLFPNTLGDIRCYAIIVSKSGYNEANSSRLDLINGEWPDIASWYESMVVDFTIPYQATKFCENLNPFTLYVTDYGKFKALKFVIGEDTETCPELSSNQHERSYCNGPLKPDTWYDVRMRAFTNGGYRDSIVFTIKTNAELQVAVVIGTIFGILFLGILITMMLLVRKGSIHAVLRRFLHSDMSGSPVPTPFNRRKFIAHCQELADNPGKLSNEFQLLQTLSVDLQMPTNAACLQANRKKNRYTDILPYDFSRVKLEVNDNDPNSDYINASFIKGCNGEEEYIACQGPKEETTHDFWRMIDQYDVKLIVMLTQLVEKNKEKCHQYYPTIRETFTYENMSIRCSSELDYKTYTQRTLILQKENEKRTILHLHFKDWPDHDVPEDFDPMINFCQIMRRHILMNRGLAVIHCSAGIGRTGTLIAIDILLQYIKENRKLDVFGTVYRLRHHRINMVQRESQYAYIYNCIRQVLKNPYFSKSYKPPSVDPITDNNSNNKKKTNSMTNLVSSLETLKKSRLSSSSIESVEQIYNSSTSTSSSSPPKSDERCLLLQGLRFSKSTSAIYSKPHQDRIVRYNTVDLPISELDNEAEEKLSSSSIDKSTQLNVSMSSIYENFRQLNRFKLANIIDSDPTVNEKLLDTSL